MILTGCIHCLATIDHNTPRTRVMEVLQVSKPMYMDCSIDIIQLYYDVSESWSLFGSYRSRT